MTTDRAGAPWGDLTYRGGAGPDGAQPAPGPKAAPPRRSPPRAAILGGGLAAALALGLLAGVWVRPELGHPAPPQPMRAVTPEPSVAIEVAQPRPAPAAQVKPAGKLEVLPPGAARAAAAPVTGPPVARSDAAASQAAPPLAVPPAPAPEAPPRYRPPPYGQPQYAPPQYAGRAAQGPCADARGLADQMVCADPRLAAADRELARAYRRALQAGAPPEALRRDQREWLADREDAARRSPRALAEAYDQRIDELEDVAADGPG
ncbi:MAG: DUF1311 domain-containing protein [Proteobacteria bacterium]|nr:DUF1311 domain-containing protein [Pseudomonadota bacterium]